MANANRLTKRYRLLDYSDEAATRTIKFSLLNRYWAPVYRRSQYEQYGAVRSCRFDRLEDEDHWFGGPPPQFKKPKHDQFLTCYIEFEDPQVVADLLARGCIYINDNKIKITPMLHHEPDASSTERHKSKDSSKTKTTDNSMLELPDESLSVNILNALNDDCLREIFRKLHLSTLQTVSNVCVRFNRIAKEIFKLKYQNEIIRFCDVVSKYPISLRRARNFLTNFGPSIKRLKIANVEVSRVRMFYNTDELLRMISKYCTNIYALELDDQLTVSDEILIELRQLFCRLHFGYRNVSPPRNDELKYLKTLHGIDTRSQFEVSDNEIDIILRKKSLEEVDIGSEYKFPRRDSGLNTNQLNRLVKGLPRLNVLTIIKMPDSVNITDTIKQVITFAKQLSILNVRVCLYHFKIPDFNEKICSELTKVIQKREQPGKVTITVQCFGTPRVEHIAQVKHITVINNEWLRVNICVCSMFFYPEYVC